MGLANDPTGKIEELHLILYPNSVISRADSFAPINCLLSGEAEVNGEYLESAKEMIRKVRKFIRPDIKEINPKHFDILSELSSMMSPEEKKRNHKILSKYFTSEFLNNPSCELSVKKGNIKIHSSLYFLISQSLILRNHKRDQTLVMTSNITRNVLDNYFDLEIPLIPSEFRNTLNYVVFLTAPEIVMGKIFYLPENELERLSSKRMMIQDNFTLSFNSEFTKILLTHFIRDKVCYKHSNNSRITTQDVCFPDKAFTELTFLELELSILSVTEKIEEFKKLDYLKNLTEEKEQELFEWISLAHNLYVLKLLAVGLHTHKDIQTPEINKHLIKISDLRKYPENVVPIHRAAHTEEVIVNESESNSFRVVRMPQGSVHLIGFKLPENYDPEKKTTVEAKVAYRWVLNRETGLKERVLRPIKEHQRPSQYRRRIYEGQE